MFLCACGTDDGKTEKQKCSFLHSGFVPREIKHSAGAKINLLGSPLMRKSY